MAEAGRMLYARLRRWARPECYVGAEWSDYYSAGLTRSRESDALERSNFRTMLAALGGESDMVLVIRELHWACGWIEWIAIHESAGEALRVADRLIAGLETYPALDEDDWSEMEAADADEVWAECYTPQDRIRYIRAHRYQFEFRDYGDMLSCVRGRYFCGYAGEMLC